MDPGCLDEPGHFCELLFENSLQICDLLQALRIKPELAAELDKEGKECALFYASKLVDINELAVEALLQTNKVPLSHQAHVLISLPHRSNAGILILLHSGRSLLEYRDADFNLYALRNIFNNEVVPAILHGVDPREALILSAQHTASSLDNIPSKPDNYVEFSIAFLINEEHLAVDAPAYFVERFRMAPRWQQDTLSFSGQVVADLGYRMTPSRFAECLAFNRDVTTRLLCTPKLTIFGDVTTCFSECLASGNLEMLQCLMLSDLIPLEHAEVAILSIFCKGYYGINSRLPEQSEVITAVKSVISHYGLSIITSPSSAALAWRLSDEDKGRYPFSKCVEEQFAPNFEDDWGRDVRGRDVRRFYEYAVAAGRTKEEVLAYKDFLMISLEELPLIPSPAPVSESVSEAPPASPVDELADSAVITVDKDADFQQALVKFSETDFMRNYLGENCQWELFLTPGYEINTYTNTTVTFVTYGDNSVKGFPPRFASNKKIVLHAMTMYKEGMHELYQILPQAMKEDRDVYLSHLKIWGFKGLVWKSESPPYIPPSLGVANSDGNLNFVEDAEIIAAVLDGPSTTTELYRCLPEKYLSDAAFWVTRLKVVMANGIAATEAGDSSKEYDLKQLSKNMITYLMANRPDVFNAGGEDLFTLMLKVDTGLLDSYFHFIVLPKKHAVLDSAGLLPAELIHANHGSCTLHLTKANPNGPLKETCCHMCWKSSALGMKYTCLPCGSFYCPSCALPFLDFTCDALPSFFTTEYYLQRCQDQDSFIAEGFPFFPKAIRFDPKIFDTFCLASSPLCMSYPAYIEHMGVESRGLTEFAETYPLIGDALVAAVNPHLPPALKADKKFVTAAILKDVNFFSQASPELQSNKEFREELFASLQREHAVALYSLLTDEQKVEQGKELAETLYKPSAEGSNLPLSLVPESLLTQPLIDELCTADPSLFAGIKDAFKTDDLFRAMISKFGQLFLQGTESQKNDVSMYHACISAPNAPPATHPQYNMFKLQMALAGGPAVLIHLFNEQPELFPLAMGLDADGSIYRGIVEKAPQFGANRTYIEASLENCPANWAVIPEPFLTDLVLSDFDLVKKLIKKMCELIYGPVSGGTFSWAGSFAMLLQQRAVPGAWTRDSLQFSIIHLYSKCAAEIRDDEEVIRSVLAFGAEPAYNASAHKEVARAIDFASERIKNSGPDVWVIAMGRNAKVVYPLIPEAIRKQRELAFAWPTTISPSDGYRLLSPAAQRLVLQNGYDPYSSDTYGSDSSLILVPEEHRDDPELMLLSCSSRLDHLDVVSERLKDDEAFILSVLALPLAMKYTDRPLRGYSRGEFPTRGLRYASARLQEKLKDHPLVTGL